MDTQRINGFLLINKPVGMTSYAVVQHIKNLVGKGVRVGHTGTLDPLATGLLIVAVGREATRQIRNMADYTKTYRVTGKFFELTQTFDQTGIVVRTDQPFHVAQEEFKAALSLYEKSYLQVPPVYSAVKHQGIPLYRLAREGRLSHEELEKIAWTKQKEVTIHKLRSMALELPFFTLEATVSHGTYVRRLINDIAQELGTVATMYELVRTQIGSVTLNQAVGLECLSSYDALKKNSIQELPGG